MEGRLGILDKMNPLAELRRLRAKAQCTRAYLELGGITGKEVTSAQIRAVLDSELALTETQRDIDKSEQLRTAQNLYSIAGRLTGIRHFRDVLEVPETYCPSEHNQQTEKERLVTACKNAIDILNNPSSPDC